MAFSEYSDFDAVGLAGLVDKGEVTPSELLEEAIARAKQVNPRINAIVHPMYDDARRAVSDGVPKGPLHGVPFLLKDLRAAYRGHPLTSGSRLFAGFVPDFHSELVKRYLKAGLVVFGKTNTPEFGILPTTEPELFGATHNPWRWGVTPGGSSGGAAASVAAGIVPMAHGGDGGGSLRIPASCCGLFGFKPSRGRIPTGPDASELFFGFASEHVISRSVRDSALALDVSTGAEVTSPYYPPPGENFFDGLAKAPGKLRIAYTDAPLLPAEKHHDCTKAVEHTAKLCESLGHHVEEARPEIDAMGFGRAFFLHFAASTAASINYAETLFGRKVTIEDVELPTWMATLVARSIDAGSFVSLRLFLLEQARQVARFFEDYDVLLTPTLGKPPVNLGELVPSGIERTLLTAVGRLGRPEILKLPGLLDRTVARAYAFAPYSGVFNVTGQPSASMPLHWNASGLPIGTMVTTRFGADQTLLRLCAQLEEAQPFFHRRPPVFAGKR